VSSLLWRRAPCLLRCDALCLPSPQQLPNCGSGKDADRTTIIKRRWLGALFGHDDPAQAMWANPEEYPEWRAFANYVISRLAPDPYAEPGPQGGDACGNPRIPWMFFTLLPNQQHQARPPHLPGEWAWPGPAARRVTISSKLWTMRERVCTSVNPNRARYCSCPCGTRSSTSGGATRWMTPSAHNGHMLSPQKGGPCHYFAAVDKVVCSRDVGKDPNMGLMKTAELRTILLRRGRRYLPDPVRPRGPSRGRHG